MDFFIQKTLLFLLPNLNAADAGVNVCACVHARTNRLLQEFSSLIFYRYNFIIKFEASKLKLFCIGTEGRPFEACWAYSFHQILQRISTDFTPLHNHAFGIFITNPNQASTINSRLREPRLFERVYNNVCIHVIDCIVELNFVLYIFANQNRFPLRLLTHSAIQKRLIG